MAYNKLLLLCVAAGAVLARLGAAMHTSTLLSESDFGLEGEELARQGVLRDPKREKMVLVALTVEEGLAASRLVLMRVARFYAQSREELGRGERLYPDHHVVFATAPGGEGVPLLQRGGALETTTLQALEERRYPASFPDGTPMEEQVFLGGPYGNLDVWPPHRWHSVAPSPVSFLHFLVNAGNSSHVLWPAARARSGWGRRDVLVPWAVGATAGCGGLQPEIVARLHDSLKSVTLYERSGTEIVGPQQPQQRQQRQRPQAPPQTQFRVKASSVADNIIDTSLDCLDLMTTGRAVDDPWKPGKRRAGKARVPAKDALFATLLDVGQFLDSVCPVYK